MEHWLKNFMNWLKTVKKRKFVVLVENRKLFKFSWTWIVFLHVNLVNNIFYRVSFLSWHLCKMLKMSNQLSSHSRMFHNIKLFHLVHNNISRKQKTTKLSIFQTVFSTWISLDSTQTFYIWDSRLRIILFERLKWLNILLLSCLQVDEFKFSVSNARSFYYIYVLHNVSSV